MSVAEVKALANGTYTELGPITFSKMKVSGSAVKYAAQDGTGGVLLYGPGILTIVTNGNFVAGDSVTIYGRKTVYSGLFEFDSISNLVAYHGFAGVPAATNIGVADLQMASTASTNLQNMLCVITNVSFNEAGGVFVPNMMHLVTDGILTGNTYIASGDPLQNTLIPSGPCAITGNYGYYTSGPQLLPDSIISAAPMQDPRVSVELNNINYGVVYPGQWRSLSFNVRNNGAHSNLTITAVAPVSGETSAFVVTTGFPITLPPGSNIYLSICYYGGAHGSTHSAVFALHSNDASNGVQNITVNGVVADYPLSLVRINELNSGVPAPYAEEFLEICGPAGTDITGWKLQFYFKNANGTVSNYANHTITNFVFTDEFDGMGYYAMVCSDYLPMPPWADDIANFDRFRYASGVYVASIRLLDTNNHQVHFFEYESDSCSDYGFAWPDDITYLYDPSTPNKSLSMIGLGMERTYLYWDVQDQTPGAANTLVQYSPFVNITNAPATVSYDTTFHTISGTNNDNVVGTMTWVNSLGGSGSIIADVSWQISDIPLIVGANVITVTGTNVVGATASDSVTITRSDIGTGAPFVDITNSPVAVTYDLTSYAVAGTNNLNVVGGMWVSNALVGGAAISFSRSGLAFVTPGVGLQVGANTITVYGTNAYGAVASDSVTITRNSTSSPTYYIGPAGSDANDGLSPATAFGTFLTATEKLANNDTLVILAGVYTNPANRLAVTEPQLHFGYKTNGAFLSGVTYKGEGPDKTILYADAAGPVPNTVADARIVRLYGTNNKVESLAIKGDLNGASWFYPVVYIINSFNGCVISNIYIEFPESQVDRTGISPVWNNSVTNLLVTRCLVDGGGVGVRDLNGSCFHSTTFRNCTLVNQRDNANAGRGAGVIVEGNDGTIIKNSIMMNQTTYAIQLWNPAAGASTTTVQNCIWYNTMNGFLQLSANTVANKSGTLNVDPNLQTDSLGLPYCSPSAYASYGWRVATPYVDVTNANASVSYDVTSYIVGGSNTSDIVGGMWVSNALASSAAISFSRNGLAFTAPPVVLNVGTNAIWVYGTNAYGMPASDSVTITRGPAGTGIPIVDMTNNSVTVSYDATTCTVGGTNNINVVGMLRWSNVATLVSGTLPAAPGWSIVGIGVVVGANSIVVNGTNAFGTVSSDSVTITRSDIGTGAPFVDITNATPPTLSYDVTSYTIGITNNMHVVGMRRWANVLTSESGVLSGNVATILLGVGANVITVTGTNEWSVSASDTITITRGPAGTGVPFVDVTNADAWVTYDVTIHSIAGTNNANVVGRMNVINTTYSGTEVSFAATAAWTAPAADIAVGANTLVVSGTNAYGTLASDSVTITRGSVGTGVPFLDVTNRAATVAYDVTEYAVAGTNNLHVMGGMLASNAANGAVTWFDATASWTTLLLPLEVGDNKIVVTGTNMLNQTATDSVLITRGGIGTGAPFVDITNATPPTLSCDVTSYTLGITNNMHVVGTRRWANALTSESGALLNNQATIPLGVGANLITVTGTNEWNVSASDTITITRGGAGTGTPFVDITNATPATLSYDVTSFIIGITNNAHVVGTRRWANALTSESGALDDNTAAIPLSVGTNLITVTGTNEWNISASDTITIERRNNRPPNQPTNAWPAIGASGIALTPTLAGTAYAEPDGHAHVVSQWQISTNAFDSILWDSEEDAAHLTSRPVPADVLTYLTRYWWRVRYKDNAGAWSAYSSPTWFETLGAVPTVAPMMVEFSSNQTTRIIYLGNAGGLSYTFNAAVSVGSGWLSILPISGTVSNETVTLVARANRTGISDGAYVGYFMIETSVGAEFTVTARVVVAGNTVVAEANGPYSCNQGSPVTFSAAGSQGRGLMYRWEVGLDFITPYSNGFFIYYYDNTSVPGAYDILLTVRDTNVPPHIAANVTALTIFNVPPTIDLGGPYQGSTTNPVVLTAVLTDPGILDTHEYRWDFNSDGTWDTAWLNTNTIAHLYTVGGSYVTTCQVKDNWGGIGADTANVLIEQPNQPPVANAVIFGTTLTETNLQGFGYTVTLSGAGSYDPDNKPQTELYYDWREDVNNPQKPVIPETNLHKVVTTTIPLSQPGEYKFHLVVFDGEYNSQPATVTVRVPGWGGEVICEGFVAKVPLWGVEVIVTNTYSQQIKTGRSDEKGLFLTDSGAGYQVAQLTRRAITKTVPISIDADGEFTENIYLLPNYYVYAGQVVTGSPGSFIGIDGAKVTLLIGNKLSNLTDAQGAFGFGSVPESWPLDGEPYIMRVQHTGFASQVRDLLMTMNHNNEMIVMTPVTGRINVSGMVLSAESAMPVGGVVVDFGNGWTATSGVEGVYGPIAVPPGDYAVQLTKQGFSDTFHYLTGLIADNTNTSLVIQGGEVSLYGEILDGNGFVITNATVDLVGFTRAKGQSDIPATGAGYYDVTVAKGTRQYIVSAPGFEPQQITISNVNDNTKLNVILVPEPAIYVMLILGISCMTIFRKRHIQHT